MPIDNHLSQTSNATKDPPLDSGYSSQEAFGAPVALVNPVWQSASNGAVAQSDSATEQTPRKQGSSSSQESDSPAKSQYSDLIRRCGIAKSDSTTSTRTHKSIPFIGAYPMGALKVHEVDDLPGASGSNEEPDAGSSKQARTAAGSPPSASAPAPPPKCLENGDCFIIIGLPDRFTVGLDTIALTTSNGKDFRGFRDIPPGPHFLWMSEPGAISRCGYWFITGPRGEVRVKQWDRYNEVLGDAASQFEVREQKKNIEDTYPSLMPHNFQGDAASTIAAPPPPPKDLPRRGSIPDPDPEFTADNITIWRQLTSAINASFLSRVTGKKAVAEWLVDTTDGAKGDIRFQEPARLIKSIVGSQLDFLFQQDIIDLQLLNFAAGDQSSSDTTPRILALLHNSDRSSVSSSDDSHPSPVITESDILAELQFTFLTGLHLGNYTCIEQMWHLLLKIILRAHALVLSRPTLVRSLLQTFHAQMVYNDRYIDHAAAAEHPDRFSSSSSSSAPAPVPPQDGELSTHSILDAIPRNKAKLREALTVYKRRLNQALLAEWGDLSPEHGAVGHAFADLEAWFWRYGWDLRSDYVEEGAGEAAMSAAVGTSAGGVMDDSDSEAGDYAPVVVQLDERGREVGLVNFND
ncbi:hypothetical protein NKR19_g1870 [Coniochaeta hoffmannii]|uniref:Uncharacterized protein n=1 Tax=Coniochaeta hoffmannii TaxID=91930 RepID=A0AA38VNN2_9PEZI|nr:hypothetical protein NKR19_g1870 [Coniochaeta hoffmannii]